MKRTSWRAAKVTLVAINKVLVGPGVKTLDHSSSMKEAMVLGAGGRSLCTLFVQATLGEWWLDCGVGSRSDVAGRSESGIRLGWKRGKKKG